MTGEKASWIGVPSGALATPVTASAVVPGAARVLGVLALEPDLYLLGPARAYLAARFSRVGAAVLLLSALAAWTVAPAAIAALKFALPRRPARGAGTSARQP